MNNKIDKSLLLPRFKDEANLNLSTLNKCLLSLEKNKDNKNLIESLMRTAHTLKGSAIIIGFKKIVDLVHKFEDIMSKIKGNDFNPDEKHFDLLFQLLDLITLLLDNKKEAYSSIPDLERKINKEFGFKEKKDVSDVNGEEYPKEDFFSEETETIRVDVDKLDNLVNLAGELIIDKMTLGQKVEDLSELYSGFEEFDRIFLELREKTDNTIILKYDHLRKNIEQLEKEFISINRRIEIACSDLQEGVMRTRMLPIHTLFNIFPRSVRDLSRSEDKLINLEISGGDTELGRSVLQKMEDPLMHLIRNAITHGIEKTRDRIDAGKPKEGKLQLNAYQKGGMVVIEVIDDGKGINWEEIRNIIIEKKIISEAEIGEMSEEQILRYIFSSGFTTRKTIDKMSGRGVGLDIVRVNIAKLKGHLNVKSVPGAGTTFTISLPLTLAITTALMVKSSGQIFAIPIEYLEETIRVSKEEIGSMENKKVIQVRDRIIPIAYLDKLLKLKEIGLNEKKYHLVAIVRAMEKTLALIVDEFLGKSDIVIKTLGDHLVSVENIAGSSILGTGDISLILDIPALLETASREPDISTIPERKRNNRVYSILLVDDSVTTSWHEKLILESAGYDVRIADNGLKALEEMAKEKPDLVIADIVMPVMDGFQLIKKMKDNTSYVDIPIIIVSNREDETFRRKGLENGADVYIAKSNFDQTNLLDTITRLLG